MKQKTDKPEPRGRVSMSDGEAAMRMVIYQSDAVFGKTPDKLRAADQHQLKALQVYYAYRHNGFILAEALDLCTRNKVNPPAWILESINNGLRRYVRGAVTPTRALSLGKRDREEYRQYRQEHPVMIEVRGLINKDPKRKIKPACVTAAGRHRLKADAVEKAYRRFWQGFFDYVANSRQG